MFKDKQPIKNDNIKQRIILIFFSIIIVLLSFFIDVVFIGLLGIILIIPSSIALGTKGALISTATATTAVIISSYMNYEVIHIINIVVSILVYWFIGIGIGKSIDTIKDQKKELEKKNTSIIGMKERLENIIEGTNVGTWEWNIQTGKTKFNDKWADIIGYKLEELSPTNISTWEKLTHPLDFINSEKELKKVMNKELEYYDFELRMKHKNGEWIWVHDRGKVIKWSEDGKPILMSGTHTDITEKKNYEQKLMDTKNEYEKVFEGSHDSIFLAKVIDDNRFEYIRNNKSHQKTTGISLEEIRGKTPRDVFGNKLGKKIEDNYKKCIKSREIINYEEELNLLTGKRILSTKLTPLIKEGKVTHIIGSRQDITVKKKAEEKDRFIQTAMKNAFDSVVITDKNFKITYINKKTESLFGYNSKEVMGESVEILYDFQDIKKLKNIVFPRLKEGKEYEGELRTIKKDGKTFICELKVTPLIDENNNIYSYVGTQTDITDKKDAEEQIYKQKEQFKTTLMSVGDAVISTDNQGKIKLMNKVAENLTGWFQEEAFNQPLEKVLKIINEHTRQNAENPAEKALRLGKTVEMENHTILITKEGKEIPIEDSAAPIKDRHGKVTGAVIVFRDFSEKREKQKQIEYLSFHDHLTGLYNRRYMEDSIKRLDTNRNIPFSIIAADINGLKLTNDAYGHRMGDKLLIATSEILKKSCRKEDIISRVGGDEFVILLPNTDEKTTREITERIKEEADNTKLDSVIISMALGYSTKNKKDEDILKTYKEADNKMYKNKLKIGKIMRNKTIETLLVNINNKYDNEHIHTERVSQYCESIAKAMNLNEKDIQAAKTAGVLHDIGKIVIDPELLNKREELTDKEWEEIKKHPTTSYQILKNVDEYAQLAEDVLYHHEKLDGTGYPEGLKEDEIPLLSKIIAVAYAYEAMTAERTYKETKTKEEAVEELKKYSGVIFDKKIVDVFINEVL